jgi:arginase
MAEQRAIQVVEAPSILGLYPSGVETLPASLVAAGLLRKLGANPVGRVEPPAYRAGREDPASVANAPGIAAYSEALADRVGRSLDEGAFPLVLGGDCSILLGNLLALRRRGRYGLLFLDGHADFYQPEAEPRGEAASMDLALATGRGPAVLTDLEGRRPLVKDEDVVVYGRRDAEDAAAHGSQRIEDTGIRVIDLAAVRAAGASTAAAEAVARLATPGLAGFWIHLDVDVLDDAVMPAVDYRMPDGLSASELVAVLQAAVRSGRAVGMHVTIFNPRLDSDGALAALLTDAVARGLRP